MRRLTIVILIALSLASPIYPSGARAERLHLRGCPASIARWSGYIAGASETTGVPVRALTGVMAIESGGNPRAVNPYSGASGLYQFLPSTARSLGINPFNPRQATYAAAWYLRRYGVYSFSGGGYGWGLVYARSCA